MHIGSYIHKTCLPAHNKKTAVCSQGNLDNSATLRSRSLVVRRRSLKLAHRGYSWLNMHLFSVLTHSVWEHC